MKVLPFPTRDAGEHAAQRLRNEARAGLRVSSPNVVRVLDCDQAGGYWYFVTEHIDGVDLGELLRCGATLDWRQAVEVACDATAGLAAIHRAGLLHRDVKPGNLILSTEGRVSVADLGIARFVEAHLAADPEVAPSGTPMYAAPESLLRGALVDKRADLFSLGVTLFVLLTGRAPYGAGSLYRALLDSHTRSVDWPSDAACDAPDWLRRAVLKLLSAAPQERFGSALELLDHFQHSSGTVQVSAAPREAETQPRGLTVLTFENETRRATDEWICVALADYLARSLARMPNVYVSDRDEFSRVLARVSADLSAASMPALCEAGRLTGAASVVRGRFQRRDNQLTVWADVVSTQTGRAVALEPLEGALSALSDLRTRLLSRVCLAMGLETTFDREPESTTPPPAAQAAFFAARRSHLAGEYEAGIQHASDALSLDPEFCEAIGLLGACSSRLGRYEEAARYHERQEALAARRGDGRQVVEAQANMGVMWYFRGEYTAALEYYSRAAHTAEALGLTTELAQICNNLGFVHYRLGRLDDARGAFQRAIETHKAFGALVFLIGPYNGMGNLLREERRFEEARDYYQRALSLALESEDRVNAGISYMHLGRCALSLGRIAVAKHELAMALSALEETRFWNGLTRVYESIAELNLQLQNYVEASRCADRQIELARAHDNRGMQAAGWRLKAQALRAVGDETQERSCLEKATELEQPHVGAA